jgi:hypothetical protein
LAVYYNGVYNNVSEIVGPSGWYIINTSAGPCHTYVNQDYDGGGWCLVIANRWGTGGMQNLTYVDATTSCNFRTGGVAIPAGSKLGSLADYNVWIAPVFWSLLSGRVTTGKVTVVQFVAGTNGTQLNGTHTKRYRWRFDGFSSRWGMIGATAISDETGTGSPGFYNYHAANGYNLTTYDVDQDAYGGSNCSSFYGNNPWWYGGCWSGNYFGYDNGPYWDSSGGDTHQYGAVYIK